MSPEYECCTGKDLTGVKLSTWMELQSSRTAMRSALWSMSVDRCGVLRPLPTTIVRPSPLLNADVCGDEHGACTGLAGSWDRLPGLPVATGSSAALLLLASGVRV